MSAVEGSVIDEPVGAPSRYVDDATVRLNILSASFEDIQTSRIRALHRNDEFSAEALATLEKQLARQLDKAVKAHPLGPWLAERKGLAGPRTGRVIARIGDPRRFPGQRCTSGHTLAPIYEPGSPCPAEIIPRAETMFELEAGCGAGDPPADADIVPESEGPGGVGTPGTDGAAAESGPEYAPCPGIMLAPRPHTGTRSLWHYAGLHVVDGHAARRQKGRQSDWSPALRTLCIGPKGLADQIVLHRPEPYRARYDEVKASKLTADLPPWRADKIAKTVAVKAFLGDLLAEWKRVLT